VCSLGLRNVFVVLITMGFMQAVASWTLSMLLQHIRRYVAISKFLSIPQIKHTSLKKIVRKRQHGAYKYGQLISRFDCQCLRYLHPDGKLLYSYGGRQTRVKIFFGPNAAICDSVWPRDKDRLIGCLPACHAVGANTFMMSSPQCRRIVASKLAKLFANTSKHSSSCATYTSSPKGIVRFWSRWKVPPCGEIHWPPPCCTTRTGQYLLDW